MRNTIGEYKTILTIKIAGPIREPVELSIQCLAASGEGQLGQPGKEIGDTLLVKNTSGQTLIISLGKQNNITSENFRSAGRASANWLIENSVERADFDLDFFQDYGVGQALQAFCEGLRLGSFRNNRYKTSSNDSTSDILIVIHTSKTKEEISNLIKQVETVTWAVNLARDLAQQPANIINPVSLADHVNELAQKHGLKCTVLDEKELAKLNAGGILGVGSGSKTPPRLIILQYPPTDFAHGVKPVALVGKAITFDTGGYSIKDTNNIQGMKFDKSGGITVLATLLAAAELKLKTPLVGIISAAENMISAEAYRPDDILTMLSGKTVEIITTDAEGRLVLADALTYAQQKYQPRVLIDLATLTGGVVTALGHVRAGIMSNNPELVKHLYDAGERTHERLWQLPLDDDYFQSIKGDDADLKNSGGRDGAPIFGGIFLKQFVNDEIPWAHLDIAGVADNDKETRLNPKGATGFGVRLLVDYLKWLESE
ncbi:MAG TPA: leucyl aminopeptidase [Anaerolineaceae bacterium]|nr:leucyl aminopeptidase [Anaerolineaceae bacterium]